MFFPSNPGLALVHSSRLTEVQEGLRRYRQHPTVKAYLDRTTQGQMNAKIRVTAQGDTVISTEGRNLVLKEHRCFVRSLPPVEMTKGSTSLQEDQSLEPAA